MNNFLEASKIKLRVPTAHGLLSVEQLWDVSMTKLAAAVKDAKKKLNVTSNDDDLSFLDETKVVDKEAQLTFDLLKEIYLLRKSENDAASKAAEDKEHNQKIMALIHSKKEAELQSLSAEELQALLR